MLISKAVHESMAFLFCELKLKYKIFVKFVLFFKNRIDISEVCLYNIDESRL